ncbi:hypothetical protein SLE2022_371620 [Rubroshorea leprosula]
MFPLHQGDDLLNQISCKTHQQKIAEDPIPNHASLDAGDATPNPSKGKRPQRKLCSNFTKDELEKLRLHRDIERRRRQDMATLGAKLRSLLPLEYIKGKRAMSDHMNEAVNYIRHLQKKVNELSVKRDELKRVSNLRALGFKNETLNHSFVVRQSCVGIEVMFHSQCYGELQGWPLSRVVGVLVEEGLNVVKCVSTKAAEGCLVHVIQAEVKDPTCFDLLEIQQKLTQVKKNVGGWGNFTKLLIEGPNQRFRMHFFNAAIAAVQHVHAFKEFNVTNIDGSI